MQIKEAWKVLFRKDKPEPWHPTISLDNPTPRPPSRILMQGSDSDYSVDERVNILFEIAKRHIPRNKKYSFITLKKKYKLKIGTQRLAIFVQKIKEGASHEEISRLLAAESSCRSDGIRQRVSKYIGWCAKQGIDPIHRASINTIQFLQETGIQVSPPSVKKYIDGIVTQPKPIQKTELRQVENIKPEMIAHSELSNLLGGLVVSAHWIETHTKHRPSINGNGGFFWPRSVLVDISYAVMEMAETQTAARSQQH